MERFSFRTFSFAVKENVLGFGAKPHYKRKITFFYLTQPILNDKKQIVKKKFEIVSRKIKMLIVTKKTDEILKEKGISHYKLSKLIGKTEGYINNVFRGERPFSEAVKKKLLPILEVSREEFESWILADKYEKEIIEKAIESFKNREDKKIPVLTQNIDRLLEEKNLSRTALSKMINHSQSGLNRVITCKEPLSKNVMTKLSTALEIPEKDLQVWVLADKYSVKVLELAL